MAIEFLGEPVDAEGKTASQRRKEVLDELTEAKTILLKASQEQKGGFHPASNSPLDNAASYIVSAIYKFNRL